MKKQIRVLGFDDAPFEKHSRGKVPVIGVFFRGGDMLDGILATEVDIDGDDSTETLIKTINKSKFKPQLRAVFLDGIAFGGFNVIDIEELNKKTNVPIIVIIRKSPDVAEMKNLLKRLKMNDKIKILSKAGKVYDAGKIFVQIRGIDIDGAREIVKISSTHSYIPEALRVAHMIGHALKKGESRGRA